MDSTNFYIPLNLPDISENVSQDVIHKLEAAHKTYGPGMWADFVNENLPLEIDKLFNKIGLTISRKKTELFSQGAFEKYPPHLDGDPNDPKNFRAFAINWVWGGKTIMEWHQYNHQELPETLNYTNHIYKTVDEKDCTLLYRSVLVGANLVNISKFHTVLNASKQKRYCLSACSEENISYEQVLKLCQANDLVRKI